MWMSWKCKPKIIGKSDTDYLYHNKICAKTKFCGLFILLLDTAFNSPNGKLEDIILPYIENVQTLPSIKVQLFQYKAQNYIILYFVHDPQGFNTNSFLGLMSLAKCLWGSNIMQYILHHFHIMNLNMRW